MTAWLAGAVFTVGKIVFGVFFGFFGLIIIVALGALLYLKISRRAPESIGVTISYAGGFKTPAFVGTGGQGARLAIREDAAGINVTVPWWTVGVIVAAMGFFGPGMLAMYLLSPRMADSTPPLPFAILAVVIVTTCCVLLVTTVYKHLFHRPRLEITGHGIRCLRGQAAVRTLAMDEIVHLASRSFPYDLSDGLTVPNYILYAKLRQGDDVPLCVTGRQQQMALLEDRLARQGYKVAASEGV